MQKIGIETVILFLLSLASFLFGASKPEWFRTAIIFSALFFIIACVVLAVTIKKRTKTRIG